MKILIVYGTHYGQTRAIACAIGERLRTGGAQTELIDACYAQHLPALATYDAIVIGSRVEMGRHSSNVLQFIRAQLAALEQLPTAFFSVSMAAASPGAGADPSGYLEDTFTSLAWRPTRAAAFAGALPYRKYGWFTRFIMKRISRAAHHTTDTSRNHEFTDWARVAQFADDVRALAQRGTTIESNSVPSASIACMTSSSTPTSR